MIVPPFGAALFWGMRLCHVSDSHLGAGGNHPRKAESGLTVRQEDILAAFVRAIDRIIELNPDLCIHSGDLFHQVRPLNTIIARAGEQLHRLAVQAGIPTVIITGNHDAPRQTHIGPALDIYRQIDNLLVATESRLHRFDFDQVAVWALPHCLTATEQKKALSDCRPDEGKRHNILVLHGAVEGMPEFSMAELGEQEIERSLLEKFDYTALGHYHNHVSVAERAFYAGSTERLSQAERESPKGLLEVNLEPFEVVFHDLPVRPMIDLPGIDASGQRGDELGQRLEKQLAEIGTEDKIIRVTVSGVSAETMATLPEDLLRRLKEKSFQLDVRFEKEVPDDTVAFGDAVGQTLDHKLAEFVRSAETEGFETERLVNRATELLRRQQ